MGCRNEEILYAVSVTESYCLDAGLGQQLLSLAGLFPPPHFIVNPSHSRHARLLGKATHGSLESQEHGNRSARLHLLESHGGREQWQQL